MKPDWINGLTRNDWLLDGRPIKGKINGKNAVTLFYNLDWDKAHVDIGPSAADNLGPYWHVPLKSGDTVHRLYPKVLKTKWYSVIRRACEDLVTRCGTRHIIEENRKLKYDLAETKFTLSILKSQLEKIKKPPSIA